MRWWQGPGDVPVNEQGKSLSELCGMGTTVEEEVVTAARRAWRHIATAWVKVWRLGPRPVGFCPVPITWNEQAGVYLLCHLPTHDGDHLDRVYRRLWSTPAPSPALTPAQVVAAAQRGRPYWWGGPG